MGGQYIVTKIAGAGSRPRANPRNISRMKAVLLVLLVVFGAGDALAQQGRKQHDGKLSRQQSMSREDRERMREDMREVNRERQGRPDKGRPRSAEEREKLRQDIEDANKNLRR
jgi:hypothetical protein